MKRALVAAIFVIAMTFSALAERRVALVFSADNYKTIRPLQNAGNDSLTVKAALEALDFEVFLETDRDLRRMRRALDDFREDAKDADVALVFFAGHGVEIGGDNRLLPVDADASSLDALKASSLPLEEVNEAVAEVGKIGLILLDACRNDPFGMSSSDGRGATALNLDGDNQHMVRAGLGRIGRAENILFAFSAAPGETAADGTGENSPFTTALAKYLGTEGLEIRSVLTLVQQEVYDFSQGRQLPYVESGLPQLFFATATGEELPERERLLLAMADITPSVRNAIERIAVDRDMPLAPLYGALISSDATALSIEDRDRKLAEAADAFVRVREEMRTLASDDPRVTRLRREAEKQLSLGAFNSARARLAEAAQIDAVSRRALKENLVERTVSEAATTYLSGGAALADLRYKLAIADYEKAAALFAEVDDEDIPAEHRFQQIANLEALGDIHVTVGNLAKASLAFEERHRVSTWLALRTPGNAGWQRDLSLSHDKIGDVRRAQGNLLGALEAYRASRDIRARLAATDPANSQWQRDLSVSHIKFGQVRVAQGDLTGALEAFQVSHAIFTRMAAADPANRQWQRDLSVSHNKIGDVWVAQGDLSEAMAAFRSGLDIAAQLAAADPGNAGLQSDLAVSHDGIGDVLVSQGNLPEALKVFQAGLDIATLLAANDPRNVRWQQALSAIYMKIGNVRVVQGDWSGAFEAFRASHDIITRMAAADPGNAKWQHDLSISHQKIGDVRVAQDNLPGALEAFQASHDIAAHLAAADPDNAGWQRGLSISHTKIGNVRVVQGDLPGALEAFQASHDIAAHLAAADPDNARWQRDLIVSHFKMAQAGGDAKLHLRKAIDIAEQMERSGMLAPSDSFIPDMLRKELGKLDVVAE